MANHFASVIVQHLTLIDDKPKSAEEVVRQRIARRAVNAITLFWSKSKSTLKLKQQK